MKRLLAYLAFALIVIFVITVLGAAGVYVLFQENLLSASPSIETAQDDSEIQVEKESPQLGLNFIRIFWTGDKTGWSEPDQIFNDFEVLGVEVFRQFVRADLLWSEIEPTNDDWQFERADAVLRATELEPVVTLFAMQYASGTEPWVDDPTQFKKELGTEGKEYLKKVVKRYADQVKYWEIGNELDHWRAANPNSLDSTALPTVYPADGFSPIEQAAFLAEVAEIVRQNDQDAIIVLPGMSNLDDYTLETWLPAVVEAGTGWFDVVNYHYYGSWQEFESARARLTAKMTELGIADKPAWLTETGSTSSETLTARTDYPNSSESQAADVFRRIIPAYAAGDQLVLWHTYVGSADTPENRWRKYGLRDENTQAELSYNSFKLLADELIPFDTVELVESSVQSPESSLPSRSIYKITTIAGEVKYVAWGTGQWSAPSGVETLIRVVPNEDGSLETNSISAGMNITLSEFPVLIK